MSLQGGQTCDTENIYIVIALTVFVGEYTGFSQCSSPTGKNLLPKDQIPLRVDPIYENGKKNIGCN